MKRWMKMIKWGSWGRSIEIRVASYPSRRARHEGLVPQLPPQIVRSEGHDERVPRPAVPERRGWVRGDVLLRGSLPCGLQIGLAQVAQVRRCLERSREVSKTPGEDVVVPLVGLNELPHRCCRRSSSRRDGEIDRRIEPHRRDHAKASRAARIDERGFFSVVRGEAEGSAARNHTARKEFENPRARHLDLDQLARVRRGVLNEV